MPVTSGDDFAPSSAARERAPRVRLATTFGGGHSPAFGNPNGENSRSRGAPSAVLRGDVLISRITRLPRKRQRGGETTGHRADAGASHDQEQDTDGKHPPRMIHRDTGNAIHILTPSWV